MNYKYDKQRISELRVAWNAARQYESVLMDVPIGDDAVSQAVSVVGGAEAVLQSYIPPPSPEFVNGLLIQFIFVYRFNVCYVDCSDGYMLRMFAVPLIELYLDGASGWIVDSKL